jgi:hypothetical protein
MAVALPAATIHISVSRPSEIAAAYGELAISYTEPNGSVSIDR